LRHHSHAFSKTLIGLSHHHITFTQARKNLDLLPVSLADRHETSPGLTFVDNVNHFELASLDERRPWNEQTLR
jgi:hypothetical protein